MKSSAKTLPPVKPLTDPVDLVALLGRLVGATVLFLVSATFLFSKNWRGLAFSAPAAFVMQYLTIRLWRKLRDERVEGEKLRAEEEKDLDAKGDNL
jgi:uncharacterized protein (DUF58 family)